MHECSELKCTNCEKTYNGMVYGKIVVSEYMKALGDEKLSAETWQRIADVNGRILNKKDEQPTHETVAQRA